ncbi:MAG: hypothetical protein U5K33_08730 [Halofilum sp. (in: g-proteobacteria)]|nr:hypothetical protein [Halofilum sp. (in: g-proteobacteria)]
MCSSRLSDPAQGAGFGGSLGGGTSQTLLTEVKFGGLSAVLSDDGSTLRQGQCTRCGDTARGRVYMFVESGRSAWSQQATFEAPNAGRCADRSGASLALSADGNALAVGAPLEDNSGDSLPGDDDFTNAGAAYVYTRSGSTWSLQGYIKASDRAGGDVFGVSVALSEDGDTLAVGAMGKDALGRRRNEGVAYVFTRSLGSLERAEHGRERLAGEQRPAGLPGGAVGERAARWRWAPCRTVPSDRPHAVLVRCSCDDQWSDDDWEFDCRRCAQPERRLSGFALGLGAGAVGRRATRLAAGAHAEDGRGEVHVFVARSGAYSRAWNSRWWRRTPTSGDR